VVSIVSNLGILFFFKYADFFVQDVLHLPVGRLGLILPAGISFHTFQSLSYTIDVYRRQLKATRSVVTFATFVLFFPQLVAGPIVRAQELLPQLETLPALDHARATAGLFRIAVGLFKKIALADRLAMIIVERVFEAPERFSAIEVLAGIYGYALQIYLDFSAYSDIAIGSADLLGFELPENFRTPYRASNLQEFWRRWHISLSTWLRDNLYIPLGGNHGAPWMTYRNLILTMVLGGLWHGASWAFVVWGALHGLGLAATRFFQRRATTAAAAARLLVACAAIAAGGGALHLLALGDASTWAQLGWMWLYLTPLWAALTAWLSSATATAPAKLGSGEVALGLRVAMVAVGVGALWAVREAPAWTWVPACAATWGLGVAADLVARGGSSAGELGAALRRGLAIVLVFHYVCLAWVFFRATSFANALAVLRQLGGLETDHANLGPVVQVTLVVGLLSHGFPDGSFGWMRARFMALPPVAQGLALAAAAMALRELAIPTIVPFIYFQF
jgi:D-alanyl-lipoteichoic acid acyltransferase DltB (MBOAT superfamily)